VLNGAIEVIKRFHPKFFIELDDNNLKEQNSSARELVQFLVDNDYTVVNAETQNKIYPELNFDNCHYDIIAR